MAFRLWSRLMRALCLAGLLPPIFSQTAEDLSFDANSDSISSYDCVDPSNRGGTHVVRRGEPTTVCLYVGPAGNWNSNINYKRFAVNLKADEFSSYRIPGCECGFAFWLAFHHLMSYGDGTDAVLWSGGVF
jgi:hypothetical protein